jgi:hypothetical protein
MTQPKPYRHCKMCKNSLPKEMFWKDKSQWDGLENRCKECSVKRTRVKRRLTQKLKIIDYLGGKCVKCGVTPNEIHWSAFDCNHKDPEEKTVNVSQIRGMLWEKVKPEVDKCELLCSNCHRQVTWEQRNATNFI